MIRLGISALSTRHVQAGNTHLILPNDVKVKVVYAGGTTGERFLIDNFNIGDNTADTTPPTICSVALMDRTHLDVLFSKPVMQTSSETVGNYVLNAGPTNPSGASRDGINIALVHLTFASIFPLGRIA